LSARVLNWKKPVEGRMSKSEKDEEERSPFYSGPQASSSSFLT
jgi:hypothetical protein